ncbi:sensor domain-containing diguanylate cyclase [Herbaspirillum sp. alder98]|uniref:GGDEF domain-containing protein n=1 Tax=Herbaspirillum sp. alder98 TaxID=2913096 RepID=UPI001CD881D2|nr:GGDEF domain-containing protein [Herbaspirillum sp. alder98]MCA1326308.1 GGDEF domain-containing protein [Herbaspirillum sp. alder98]
MALDPSTILVLSTALAAAAALYLAVEWNSVRERSLLLWSAGFAVITVGCVLALLRSKGYLLIGIWFANGLLIGAHWLFLAGVAWFTRTRLSRGWTLVVLAWLLMLLLPSEPWWSRVMLCIQSLLIAGITLRASFLLRPHGVSLSVGAVQLRYVLMAHGLFYIAKAASTLALGAFVDLAAFRGEVIQISLVEGSMAIMLIALSMTGTERHRREERIEQLAARDPLTALFNRRALDMRAPALFEQASAASPGALLLIDIDNFKQANDLHGHSAGDKLLVALSEMIREFLPQGSLAARLGGDEFVILLREASADGVVALGNDLREAFAKTAREMFATPKAVTLSVGATLFERPPSSLATLLDLGDAALYESKRAGRDRVRVVPLG